MLRLIVFQPSGGSSKRKQQGRLLCIARRQSLILDRNTDLNEAHDQYDADRQPKRSAVSLWRNAE